LEAWRRNRDRAKQNVSYGSRHIAPEFAEAEAGMAEAFANVSPTFSGSLEIFDSNPPMGDCVETPINLTGVCGPGT
jgi:hypothetical protein